MSEQKKLTREYFSDPTKYLLSYVTDASAWECFTIIQSMVPLADGLRILDVGCGPGFMAWTFSLEGHEVVGIDISAEMIEFANKHYASKNAKYLLGDIEDEEKITSLGLYDVIIAKGVFEYLLNNEKAFGNIWWLLKPSGFLIAEFRNASFTYGSPDYVDPYPMKRRAHSESTLKQQAKKWGFHHVETMYYHHHNNKKIPESASAFIMKLQKV